MSLDANVCQAATLPLRANQSLGSRSLRKSQ
jgi:hypothetical protein